MHKGEHCSFRPRVIYLHQYFCTPQMIGGTRSYEMGKRLVRSGFDVEVIAADCTAPSSSGWRKEMVEGMLVHWAPVPYDNSMSFSRRILAFFDFSWRASLKAAKVGGDLVFASSTPLTIALPGIFASWARKIPLVLEVRDMWPSVPIAIGALRDPFSILAAKALEQIAYRKANHIIALAPGMKEEILAKGVPSEKVSVIPNGSDMDLFDIPSYVGEEVRRQNLWLGQRPMVLYSGAIGFLNGVDYLVHLAHKMLEIDPAVCFVLIGRGKEDGLIRDLAKTNGTFERNVFFLGPKPKEEIPAWVSASSMMITLIKIQEVAKNAVQNKFFDALAGGRPVANNFSGWQSQIAQENDCGIVLDPQNPYQGAEVLAKHLKNKEWLEGAGRRAHDLAKNQYNRDNLANELGSVFRKVLF